MEREIQHVYLVRHGQTALNAEGRLRGLANPPLDDVGIDEARRVARVIADLHPALILSSPLDRATHTANIIAEEAGVPSSVDERFNDRDYGPWTGRVKSEVVDEWGSVDAAPGVESLKDVLDRVRPALDAVLDRAKGSVTIVTHDAVMRPLIAALDPSKTNLLVPTGSWNDLVRADGRWIVLATDQVPGL